MIWRAWAPHTVDPGDAAGKTHHVDHEPRTIFNLQLISISAFSCCQAFSYTICPGAIGVTAHEEAATTTPTIFVTRITANSGSCCGNRSNGSNLNMTICVAFLCTCSKIHSRFHLLGSRPCLPRSHRLPVLCRDFTLSTMGLSLKYIHPFPSANPCFLLTLKISKVHQPQHDPVDGFQNSPII